MKIARIRTRILALKEVRASVQNKGRHTMIMFIMVGRYVSFYKLPKDLLFS